jgi:hypothetical protein
MNRFDNKENWEEDTIPKRTTSLSMYSLYSKLPWIHEYQSPSKRPRDDDPIPTKKSCQRQEEMYSQHLITHRMIQGEYKDVFEDSIFSMPRCTDIFHKFAINNEISGLGLQQFQSFLGYKQSPFDNISYLLLMMTIESKRHDRISHQEWVFGFQSIECDSFEKLRSKLDSIQNCMSTWTIGDVKNFFTFVFNYFKSDGKKYVETKYLIPVLYGVLNGSYGYHFEMFCEFLEDRKISYLNLDQWRIYVDFSICIKPDFTNYSSEDAWPLIYDEYVKWALEKKKKHVMDRIEIDIDEDPWPDNE